MDFLSPNLSLQDLPAPPPADESGESRPLDLSILIVNYESWPDTVCLVYSLLRSAGILRDGTSLAPRTTPLSLSLEILVVDNGSQPHPLMKTLDGLPRVQLLLETENRGFATGVNRGWRSAQGRHLLVLNPDLLIPASFLSAVAQRIQWLDERRDNGTRHVGILGFGLLNHDGSRQYSTGYFPKIWWTLAGQMFPRWRRKYRALHARRPHAADWVSGACFLARREVFDLLEGMDEAFFLYYEEVDFCLRARRAGWSTMHDPGVRVMHLHPLERRPTSTRFREITRKSQLHYFRKNLPAWHHWVLVGAIWCEQLGHVLLRSMARRAGRHPHRSGAPTGSVWGPVFSGKRPFSVAEGRDLR